MGNQMVIYGGGGFGREVMQIVRDLNVLRPTWVCVGFIVDSRHVSEPTVHGLPILGGIEWLKKNPSVSVVVAVGSSAARQRVVNKITENCENSFASMVHPRAWIGENVEIGEGSVICAGALITTDITLDKHVHVNIGATIGHDAVLEKYVTLNPSVNVSGNVVLRQGAEIGTGSVIIPNCVVGEWSIVGAGSVVIKSLKENCTAVGSPAKVIKEHPLGWQIN